MLVSIARITLGFANTVRKSCSKCHDVPSTHIDKSTGRSYCTGCYKLGNDIWDNTLRGTHGIAREVRA